MLLPDPPFSCATLPTSYFDGLLARIKAGDDSAKDELIRDAFGRCHRLCRLILRGGTFQAPTGLTDDVFGLSYPKFADKLKAGMKHDFANLRQMLGYVAQIVRRTSIDVARVESGPVRNAQFPKTELGEGRHDRGCNHAASEIEMRAYFQEIVEGLPESERDLIDLKYLYEFNDTEIAAIIRVERRKIHGLVSRILLKLRDHLES